MPEYNYRALDNTGRSITGSMVAVDESLLEEQLADMGQVLIESSSLEDVVSVGGKEFKLTFLESVKPREVIDFFIQFRGLLNAGVPMLEGLRGMQKGSDNPYFRKVLDAVCNGVESGETLADSFSAHPKAFDSNTANMIRAGEESGRLPETFADIIAYMEWVLRMKSDVKQATIYPVTVLIVIVMFIGLLFTFVVPKFVTLLVSLDVELPMPTIIVMAVSDFAKSYGVVSLMFVAVIPFIIGAAKKKSQGFSFWWDSMKLKLPVFGKLNKMFVVSKFATNFAALFKAGIPVLQNLELCQELVGNLVMEKALREAKADIEGGMTLYESMGKHDIFNSMELMMLSVGEQSGDLGAPLESISSYYDEVIPRTIKTVFGIVEPAIMITMIGIVGFTALAIFMPIMTLMSSVG